ncbi:P-loop containing nucleoside triphosphate hydrolase protein [Zopfochytrium polystomum]|nr:P-loop containing nucleoside triphosphate hydrolase protein [Zopfochytrium polystomum]
MSSNSSNSPRYHQPHSPQQPNRSQSMAQPRYAAGLVELRGTSSSSYLRSTPTPQRPSSSASHYTDSSSYDWAMDRKREVAEKKRAYLDSFCGVMALTQHASRPKSVSLLKSFFVTYRSSNPIRGLSPSSMIYFLRRRQKVLLVDYDTKMVQWRDSLMAYGMASVASSVAALPPRPESAAGRIQRQPLDTANGKDSARKPTTSTLALLNQPREQLQLDKHGITVHDVQEMIRSEFAKSTEHFDEYADADGAIVVPMGTAETQVVFMVRLVPAAKPMPGDASGSPVTRTMSRGPYLLVGQPGLSLGVPPRSTLTLDSPIVFTPGKSVFFVLKIRPVNHGVIKDTIVLNFGDFVICRYIHLRVEDVEIAAEARLHRAKEAYTGRPNPPKSVPFVQAHRIFKGIPPPLPNFASIFKVKLKEYPIPEYVRDMVDDPKQSTFEEDDPFPMTVETLPDSLMQLQYIEELQMERDIRNYDMEALIIKGQGSFRINGSSMTSSFFSLRVPGLAEKRPSVLYGDSIYASTKNDPSIEYEGRVHDVNAENVHLVFSSQFEAIFNPKLIFRIRFEYSRVPLRCCYQALDLVKGLDPQLLFPTRVPDARKGAIPLSPLRDEAAGMAELNGEQRMAVRNVVERRHGHVPYVIFGPPGTGKTKTIVQCIVQSHVCKRNDPRHASEHYLVLAPSNLAADLLIEKLADFFNQEEMLRLNSYRRPLDYKNNVPSKVSKKVMEYSMIDESGPGKKIFKLPQSAEDVMKYRVVVTTAVSASFLYAMGVPRGFYTSFFIDEAGQATEPEFWAAIAGLIGSDGQIVLAGDPKQLGPILRSAHAKKFGLGKSYMERLTELPIYRQAVGDYNPSTSSFLPSQQYVNPHIISKLVRNYRSHPKILSISSSLFYNRELIASADVGMRESFQDWDMLPKKGFPIIFQGVNGKDEQEGNSPSWFNADEVSFVKRWVNKIYTTSRGKGVMYGQMGIITPYRRQAQKIATSVGGLGIKIASVEEFQGQECRIIIISTVRSSVAHIQHDLLHSIGFLRNEKRFNVACSRAMALLVVIGNPVVLSQDRYWGAFVRYCRSNGAIIGYDPEREASDGGDEIKRLVGLTERLRMAEEKTAEEEELMVQLGENDGSGVGEVQLQEDPAWSREM